LRSGNNKLSNIHNVTDRKSILISNIFDNGMRGRWASAALGAGIARRRMGAEMEQQQQSYDAQQQQAQRQIEAQQRQIEALQQQQRGQPSQHQQSSGGQEDVTSKLQKLADLHQKGLLTDDEFSKMKMNLLSQL
jgi:Tfp pilus assembly protein FimV